MGNSNSHITNNNTNMFNVVPDALDMRDIYYDTTEIDKKIQLQKEIKEANELNIDIEINTPNKKQELTNNKQEITNDNNEETQEKILLKKHVDLRINIDVLPIYMYSMNEIGTSIPCAICSIIYAKLAMKNNTLFCPSRCFLLYNTFLKNGIISIQNESNINDNETINNEYLLKYSNQKLSIRDYLRALKQFGICDEKNYQCNVETLAKKPSEYCYNEGRYLQFNYKKVKNNLDYIKYLLSNDNIILCSLSVYASFMDSDTIKSGKIKIPHKEYDSHIGMIACTIVGYIEKQQQFILRFSLGNSWGDKGYGYISYEYAKLLINDMWIIELEIPFIGLNMRNNHNIYNNNYNVHDNNYNTYNNQEDNYQGNFYQMHQQLNPNLNTNTNTNNMFGNFNSNNSRKHNTFSNKEMIDRKKYMIGGMSAI